MIYPTIKDLNKDDDYNRYEIALATAKCARMITNEYVRQREDAERAISNNKENEKPLNSYIDKEMRDEKAVKIAIARIHCGDYAIIHKDPALQEAEERALLNAILNRTPPNEYNPHLIMQNVMDESKDIEEEDLLDEEDIAMEGEEISDILEAEIDDDTPDEG